MAALLQQKMSTTCQGQDNILHPRHPRLFPSPWMKIPYLGALKEMGE
jgi:hypothetical protein